VVRARSGFARYLKISSQYGRERFSQNWTVMSCSVTVAVFTLRHEIIAQSKWNCPFSHDLQAPKRTVRTISFPQTRRQTSQKTLRRITTDTSPPTNSVTALADHFAQILAPESANAYRGRIISPATGIRWSWNRQLAARNRTSPLFKKHVLLKSLRSSGFGNFTSSRSGYGFVNGSYDRSI
jgi:hypothetical protein